MMVTAILLAGGKGTRLGSAIPKQYMEICEKPVLAYTLEAFQRSLADRLIIVAAEEYRSLCGKIANHFHCGKVVDVIGGGAERYDSVRKGLQYLADKQEPDEIVLIQDGARPFILPETINQIIKAVEQSGAAIAATPCTDTIKLVDEGGFIVSTTDRKRTWAAQTPQGFWLRDIYSAYERVFRDADADSGVPPFSGITDDAMVYQLAFPDRKVRVIDAGSSNFKITTAQDLQRGESLLKSREQAVF